MSIAVIGVTAPGPAATALQTPRRSKISRAPCDSASDRSPRAERACGARVERDDVEVAVGERQRQRRADRAGADDGEIMQHRIDVPRAAAAQAASTSATVLGVAAVRFSLPSAVTSTSSSMRTPISQNASGTLSAGRM